MQVQTLDSVFIRAPRRALHPVIADVGGWAQWWPGLRVGATPSPHAQVMWRAPGLRRGVCRWTVEVARVRPDLGIQLRYDGDIAGDAEFYYLDETAGTVVSYAFRGRVADAGWRAAVRHHRAGARAALDALKDRFEGDRLPGAEPDPALLAEQQRASAAFAEGVAAWERTVRQATPRGSA